MKVAMNESVLLCSLGERRLFISGLGPLGQRISDDFPPCFAFSAGRWRKVPSSGPTNPFSLYYNSQVIEIVGCPRGDWWKVSSWRTCSFPAFICFGSSVGGPMFCSRALQCGLAPASRAAVLGRSNIQTNDILMSAVARQLCPWTNQQSVRRLV